MTEKEPTQPRPRSPQIPQQLGILNLRLNDMVQELNTTIKLLVDTNTTLQQENAELKNKLEKGNSS